MGSTSQMHPTRSVVDLANYRAERGLPPFQPRVRGVRETLEQLQRLLADERVTQRRMGRAGRLNAPYIRELEMRIASLTRLVERAS